MAVHGKLAELHIKLRRELWFRNPHRLTTWKPVQLQIEIRADQITSLKSTILLSITQRQSTETSRIGDLVSHLLVYLRIDRRWFETTSMLMNRTGPAFDVVYAPENITSNPSVSFDNETVYLVGWHIHTPADHTVNGFRSRAELHLVYVHRGAK